VAERVILATAPLRGPGLDALRELGEVVLDPWIDHQPLRLYNSEQLGERIAGLAGADFAAPIVAHPSPPEQNRRPEVRAIADREPRRTRPVNSEHSSGRHPSRAASRPPQDDGERPRRKDRRTKRRPFDAERLGEPELARREKRRRFRRKRG